MKPATCPSSAPRTHSSSAPRTQVSQSQPLATPTLYLIHGWTYTVEPWRTTLNLLDKQGIKVKMLHVPGLTAPSRKVWTIADYTAWADQNIPNGAIALGHSNGGRILLNLLSHQPDKLRHLILLDAAGVYEPSKKRNLLRWLSKTFAPLKKVKFFHKAFHKVIRAHDYAKAPENMKKTLSNMLDSDQALNLSAVTTPTTILWGQDDHVTPPRQAQVLHQQLPHNTLKLYRGWSHAPYISHPRELAAALTKIIKELS